MIEQLQVFFFDADENITWIRRSPHKIIKAEPLKVLSLQTKTESILKETSNNSDTKVETKIVEYFGQNNDDEIYNKKLNNFITYMKIIANNFAKLLPDHAEILFLDNDKRFIQIFKEKLFKVIAPESFMENGLLSRELFSHHKYDAIWLNNTFVNDFDFNTVKNFNSLSTLIKDDGLIFISFPYGKYDKPSNIGTRLFQMNKFKLLSFLRSNKIHFSLKQQWIESYINNKNKFSRTYNIILENSDYIHNLNKPIDDYNSNLNIVYLKLITFKSSNLENDKNYKQKLLITNKGCVVLSTYDSLDTTEPQKFSLTTKLEKSITPEESLKIFAEVYYSLYFSKDLPENKDAHDLNYWTINLKEINGDEYKATGNYASPLLYKGTNMTKIINDMLEFDDFFGFSPIVL